MKMHPVSSSNIAAIGYDDQTSTLRVQFNDGSQYDYYGVPNEVFNHFLSSPSKGQYLHQNIKGNYAYAKL